MHTDRTSEVNSSKVRRRPRRSRRTQLLPDVLETNILTLLRVRQEAADNRSAGERLADWIAEFSGSLPFLGMHVAWFGLWIVANAGWQGVKPFDPFPYGLLTMIVSLEAIFLATFVLISQNRLQEEADRRGELDVDITLLAEHELTHLMRVVEAIAMKLEIDLSHKQTIQDLKEDVEVDAVLEKIDTIKQNLASTEDSGKET